jgi:orotate phosphoribosyltransferase
MSDPRAWREQAAVRAAELERRGVFWRHDGNPKRPYVRLRSGLISNGYFNGGVIMESPALLADVTSELVHEYADGKLIHRLPNRVIGPAMGAITLAHEVARLIDNIRGRHGNTLMSFAEKDGEQFVFRRNPPKDGELILLVEDTLTTGISLARVCDAIYKIVPKASILPDVLCVCNRTGASRLSGMDITSYVNADFRTWKEGENPFTPDGKELVPVVENAKENWRVLTQKYP